MDEAAVLRLLEQVRSVELPEAVDGPGKAPEPLAPRSDVSTGVLG